MRPYEPCPSPQRLHQASLLVIGLAGASTGLLAGIGWRLFHDGFRELAVLVWLVSTALVILYLLVALLARAIALLVDAGRPTDFARALHRLKDRVDELERELVSARASLGATTPPLSTPPVSSMEPSLGTSAF